ncbi:MAG: SMI1/KNR4 family protein [Ruminococcus sp.]|nr:SMI1/KNR4 family protein [Ruminococcus sp.]
MDLSKYDVLDFPERLKMLVSLAGKADKKCEVFGSRTYKYKFNPPASLSDVHKFEEKYKIKIPDSFVRYLTEIGNGGAGVDYGVYTLERIQKEIDAYETMNPDSDKTIFDYENYAEKWAELCTELDTTDDDETYNRIEKQLVNGWLIIGTAGCTYDYVIMCKGKNYGKVAGVDWNMFEDNPPYILSNSFENWIETYFRKIIQGNLIDRGCFKSVKDN